MLEFDLVPAGYRAELRVKRWLRNFLVVLAISIGLIAVTRVGLAIAAAQAQQQITEVKANADEITKQRAELGALTAQNADYVYRASVLASHHSTPGPRALLQLLDETITDHTRVTKVELSNRNEFTDKELPEQKGVTLVSSTANANKWRFSSDVTLTGQARRHSDLYDFADRLQAHPFVARVNVEKNTLRRYEETNIVDFEIKIHLMRTS